MARAFDERATTEAKLGRCQIPYMELFAIIVNDF